MKYDVVDINTDEVMGTFSNVHRANSCAHDMNAGKLDKLYKVVKQPRRSLPKRTDNLPLTLDW